MFQIKLFRRVGLPIDREIGAVIYTIWWWYCRRSSWDLPFAKRLNPATQIEHNHILSSTKYLVWLPFSSHLLRRPFLPHGKLTLKSQLCRTSSLAASTGLPFWIIMSIVSTQAVVTVVYGAKLRPDGQAFWGCKVREATVEHIKFLQSVGYDGQAKNKVYEPWDTGQIERDMYDWNDDVLMMAQLGMIINKIDFWYIPLTVWIAVWVLAEKFREARFNIDI